MTQKITFQKSGENEAVQKLKPEEGTKLGLKETDEWLAKPLTYWESDWIFRLKAVPFELSLNGEKRKIETVDFYVNANNALNFFLTNALQENNDFELQWNEEQTGKYVGFSENRPNSLVVYSNFIHNGKNEKEYRKNRQFWDIKDLEVDWENITLLEGGLSFDLSFPQSVSNFTYDKVYLALDYSSDEYEWIKKRLTEWKENKKPLVIESAALSTRSWLSVKNSNNLYVVDKKEIKGLSYEFSKESILGKISGWEKLPYREKAKFLKWRSKGNTKDLKNEIQAAIRAFENGDNIPPFSPSPNQNNPAKTTSPNQIPWKIIIPVSLFFLIIIVIGAIMVFKKKKKNIKVH